MLLDAASCCSLEAPLHGRFLDSVEASSWKMAVSIAVHMCVALMSTLLLMHIQMVCGVHSSTARGDMPQLDLPAKTGANKLSIIASHWPVCGSRQEAACSLGTF